jgi:hypothetical protein
MEPNSYQTTNFAYGTQWIADKNEPTSLKELVRLLIILQGDNAIKLRYLKKSYKSIRRIEQQTAEAGPESGSINEKYKYDKNAIVAKKFPFSADQFKYPHDGNTKPKTLYIRHNDEYGSKKPNDLELPGKIYFVIS